MNRHSIVCLFLLAAPLSAAAPPARDPLPPGAVARLGRTRLPAPERPLAEPFAVSPDGRHLLAYSRWFRLADGEAVPPPVHVPKGYAFARFFADGSHAVSGGDETLVFAAKSDNPRARIPFASLWFDGLGRTCVRLSEKQDALYVADLRAGGKALRWKKVATGGVSSWSGTSHDGRRAVWLDRAEPPRLCVYDFAADEITRIFPKTEGRRVHCAALGPDGKLAACFDDAAIHLYEVDTAKPVRTAPIESFTGSYDCRFTPDGKHVLFMATHGATLVPTDPAKPVIRSRIDVGFLEGWSLFADSRRVAVVDAHRVVRVHDLTTGEQLDSLSRFPSFVGVRMVGRHVAASWTACGRVVTWDVRDGRAAADVALKAKDEFASLAEVRHSPDGRHVAAWGRGFCLLAHACSGEAIAESTAEGDDSMPAFFHPVRGEVAIYDPARGGYAVHDPATGRRLRALAPSDVGEGGFSPDGRTFVVASDGSISLREQASGKARWTSAFSPVIDLASGRATDCPCRLFLTEKGRTAAVVRAQEALLFDTRTGHVKRTVPFRSHLWNRPAAASADGRWLAIMDAEQIEGQEDVEPRHKKTRPLLRVFDLSAKDPTKDAYRDVWRGPFVRSMTMTGDGSRLVTAHGDGTCLVWDLERLVARASSEAPRAEWERLADLDPSAARPAVEALAKDAPKALELFASKLTPAAEADPKRLSAWIDELDSEDFVARAAAERKLADAGDQAETKLREAVQKPASVEQARRAEALLERLDPQRDGRHLRELRALEILEAIGSKEAVALLERLAKGAPAARLTREAKASLRRLKEGRRLNRPVRRARRGGICLSPAEPRRAG